MFCLKSFTMNSDTSILMDFCWILVYEGEIESTYKRKKKFFVFFYFVWNVSNAYQHCNKETHRVFFLLFILEMIKRSLKGWGYCQTQWHYRRRLNALHFDTRTFVLQCSQFQIKCLEFLRRNKTLETARDDVFTM